MSTHKIFLFIAIVLMITTACDKLQEEDPQPDQDQDGTTQADPNEVTNSLIFEDMQIISGSPPEVNTSLGADLKINRDTIFWLDGITNRILIKRPEDVNLKGVWIWVGGSHSYIEARFREEEETQEVNVLYYDFDPDGWEFPVTFPITIIPFDDDGNALDKFTKTVENEEPIENSETCDFNYGYAGVTLWEWISTEDKANNFFAAPMYPFLTTGTTMGCCVDGKSSQNINCPSENAVELQYENYYTIEREVISISFDSFFAIVSEETTRNFDPGDSDFCSQEAGYDYDEKFSVAAGKYQVNEDCHLVFDYEHRDHFVYVGSKFKPISQHYIEEVSDFGTMRRVYVMLYIGENNEPMGYWRD